MRTKDFKFMSCDASKTSLVCCGHSFVVLMHRNSCIKIVRAHFPWNDLFIPRYLRHNIISLDGNSHRFVSNRLRFCRSPGW